jgi:hypothetical protein
MVERTTHTPNNSCDGAVVTQRTLALPVDDFEFCVRLQWRYVRPPLRLRSFDAWHAKRPRDPAIYLRIALSDGISTNSSSKVFV